jgi:thiol-disulfide isomerase/thioredoxin
MPFLLAAVLVAVLVIGLTQAGGRQDGGTAKSGDQAPFRLDEALASLAGAPAPLASLHEQANRLLGGGPKALEARLKTLRGHPVVLNKWASWCGPCRHEFPFFQHVSTKRGRTVAFVGLNSGDPSKADARKFLSEFPLTYPSYEDPSEKIARAVGAPANYPITVFYDAKGQQAFIRQGGYASAAELERDIDRYLRP